jgi:hypothetical protein
MSLVSAVCCVCVGLITVPRSFDGRGVSECDREASILRRPLPTRGCCATGKTTTGIHNPLTIANPTHVHMTFLTQN